MPSDHTSDHTCLQGNPLSPFLPSCMFAGHRCGPGKGVHEAYGIPKSKVIAQTCDNEANVKKFSLGISSYDIDIRCALHTLQLSIKESIYMVGRDGTREVSRSWLPSSGDGLPDCIPPIEQ